jgi:hypothetical protein
VATPLMLIKALLLVCLGQLAYTGTYFIHGWALRRFLLPAGSNKLPERVWKIVGLARAIPVKNGRPDILVVLQLRKRQLGSGKYFNDGDTCQQDRLANFHSREAQ